jgi:predicted glycosyltransferase
LVGYSRRAVERAGTLVHVLYVQGGTTMSVYQQPGTLDWERMPAGQRVQAGSLAAWETARGGEAILVAERDGMVVTVVARAQPDEMMQVAARVPEWSPSLAERVNLRCSELVESFTGGR